MHTTSRERLWNRRRIGGLLATLAVLAVVLILYSRFLAYNETRAGSVLDDPLLQRLPAVELSVPIFTVIYAAILLALVTLARDPDRLTLTLRAYALLMLVRIAAMYATPLAPPAGMLPLHDPVAGLGPGSLMLRDLFFSGHTATLTLLALSAGRRSLRWAFAAAAALIGVMVLLQRCHYTVDVIAAPFFAYGCYRLAWPRAVGHRLSSALQQHGTA